MRACAHALGDGGEHLLLPRTVDWQDMADKAPLPFSLHLKTTGRVTPPTTEVASEMYQRHLDAQIQLLPHGLNSTIDFICVSGAGGAALTDRPRSTGAGAQRHQARPRHRRDRAPVVACVVVAWTQTD